MGWIHDTGYAPAYAHEGYAAGVLADGTDTGTWTAETGPKVTGWRAACDCGWRSPLLYPRAEHPSEDGFAPEPIEGFETGGGCYAEWRAHLAAALPELAVYDAWQAIREHTETLEAAITRARGAGVTWAKIGEAADMSKQAAWQRWQHLDTPPAQTRDDAPAEQEQADTTPAPEVAVYTAPYSPGTVHASGLRGTLHYARCACGWHSADVTQKQKAEAAAQDHADATSHRYTPIDW